MATTNWYANKDARIAYRTSDGWSAGAGKSNYLPVGLYSGYRYRTLIGFGYSFAGMVSITSAILHLRTSTQYYVAFGSDPDINVYRLTQNWSEGTAVSLSATNAVEWDNQPSHSGTNATGAPKDVTTSEGTWFTVDVTNLVQAAFSAGVFYGLKIIAVDEGTATDVTEFYARETSSDAYITVTYSTNSLPTAPTNTYPVGSALIVDDTPTLAWTHNDPDSDPVSSWDLEVEACGNGATPQEPSWILPDVKLYGQTTGISGDNITHTLSTLQHGYWQAWRTRTYDAVGGSPWSTVAYFRVHGDLTVTWTEPAGDSEVGRMYYDAGSDTDPRFWPAWTFSCPHGHTQSSGTFYLRDSGGSPLANYSVGIAWSYHTTYVPTRGSTYRYDLDVVCSGGRSGSATQRTGVKAQWGRAAYKVDTTGATTFADPNISTLEAGDRDIVLEYGSSPTGTEPTDWKSSVSGVAPDDYFHYRATLLGWGSASPTTPYLYSITINWSTLVAVADYWTFDANSEVEVGQFLYGTQCLKVVCENTVNHYGYVDITGLQPATTYTFSGYVKTDGDARPALRIYELGSLSGALATSEDDFTIDASTGGWTRIWVQWYSGEATTCRLIVGTMNQGTTGATARFDALEMEASTVVSPWSPGYVGEAITIDVGGVQVNGVAGGVFRLRGATGGARDEVELGDSGLVFGGDAEVSAPVADEGIAVPKLRILDNTDDVTLASTVEPFRIGAASSQNLAMDGNEIASRNNGAVSELNLNADGGEVVINVNSQTSGGLRIADGAYLSMAGLAGRSGLAPIRRLYTSGSGSWTKPSGLAYIEVEVAGGGGGSGGVATTSAGEGAASGGGGGGGYSRKLFTAADLSGASSFSYSVGGGGTAGTAGANDGGSGGTSSFSGTGITTVQATGGGGGTGGTASSGRLLRAGGSGGSGSGGDLNATGADGQSGNVVNGDVTAAGAGGAAAGAYSGGGGVGPTASGVGSAGNIYGGGGGGSYNQDAQGTARAGAAGAAGRVVVTEHYL